MFLNDTRNCMNLTIYMYIYIRTIRNSIGKPLAIYEIADLFVSFFLFLSCQVVQIEINFNSRVLPYPG